MINRKSFLTAERSRRASTHIYMCRKHQGLKQEYISIINDAASSYFITINYIRTARRPVFAWDYHQRRNASDECLMVTKKKKEKGKNMQLWCMDKNFHLANRRSCQRPSWIIMRSEQESRLLLFFPCWVGKPPSWIPCSSDCDGHIQTHAGLRSWKNSV